MGTGMNADVEKTAQTEGLVAAAKQLGPSRHDDMKAIAALAEGASSRKTLVSDADVEAIGELSGTSFFGVQIVLCEVIPLLDALPAEVMALTSMLVERGGEDIAANQPNAAFRTWCAKDESRADSVIGKAREGDALSLDHLVFALEAKGDADEAFRSASSGGKEQAAGALALSRMTLDFGQAERAVALLLDASEKSDFKDAFGLIKAALDIAGTHPDMDRKCLTASLERLTPESDPLVVHLMAEALHWHGEEMTDSEVGICLRGISAIDPKSERTVQQIEGALRRLWPSRPVEVGEALAVVISRTKGQVGKRVLEAIFPKKDQLPAAARIATKWLQDGDRHVCSALASQFSEINRTSPCIAVRPDDLPEDDIDQIFVCRKAVGYFFLAPITAATWIVAVLRKGGVAADEVAELLFDPLLLNYGGALKDWLEGLLDEEARGNDSIQDALARAQEVLDGIDAAREVVEFEPSSFRQTLVRYHETEKMERALRIARKNSILAQLGTTQTILYGDRASLSIRDGDGIRRTQTANMVETSVSQELAKGLIFDPVGTESLLETFRFEKRRET